MRPCHHPQHEQPDPRYAAKQVEQWHAAGSVTPLACGHAKQLLQKEEEAWQRSKRQVCERHAKQPRRKTVLPQLEEEAHHEEPQ